MSKEKRIFEKLSLSVIDQIKLLKKRGLHIPDEERAVNCLQFIGYYRLSGYGRFYYDDPNLSEPRFKKNTSFEQILELYAFDRELRLLINDAVERIEVAIRSCVSNTLSCKYGAHWYMKKNSFNEKFRFDEFMRKIRSDTGRDARPGTLTEQKREDIFQHYYKSYDIPELPPSWMVAEVLSFGSWSLIFDCLALKQDKRQIADTFGLHPQILRSWLHSLSFLRNLCAHHARIWNRHFKIAPIEMKTYKHHFKPNYLFYAQASMLHILLRLICDGSDWPHQLRSLFLKHAWIPIDAMGFPKNWHKDSFWQSDQQSSQLDQLDRSTFRLKPIDPMEPMEPIEPRRILDTQSGTHQMTAC